MLDLTGSSLLQGFLNYHSVSRVCIFPTMAPPREGVDASFIPALSTIPNLNKGIFLVDINESLPLTALLQSNSVKSLFVQKNKSLLQMATDMTKDNDSVFEPCPTLETNKTLRALDLEPRAWNLQQCCNTTQEFEEPEYY
jgi:hypothetical protein